MRQLIDLICDKCGEQTERYIAETSIPCHCGGVARKVIGMPRIALDGTDDGFPGAYSKWATIREENARIKAKRDSN